MSFRETPEFKLKKLITLLRTCTKDEHIELRKYKRKLKMQTTENKTEAIFNQINEISTMIEKQEIPQEKGKMLMNAWIKMLPTVQNQVGVVVNAQQITANNANMVNAKELFEQVVNERRLKKQAEERNKKLIEDYRVQQNLNAVESNQQALLPENIDTTKITTIIPNNNNTK